MIEKVKLKVIGKNVLIKKANQQKFGNLLLLETSSDNFLKGVVCGIGAGKEKDAATMEIAIGNEVLFPKHKGHEMRVDDSVYVILPYDEIIAIVEKEK